MKRNGLIAITVLTMLSTSAIAASQAKPEEEMLMPEVSVTGRAEARSHPQDGNWSERPLGCAEVVTPSGTGNELGGHFQGRFAREGIPVIPSLNDPSSASDHYQKGPNMYHQVTRAGQEGKAGCGL